MTVGTVKEREHCLQMVKVADTELGGIIGKMVKRKMNFVFT